MHITQRLESKGQCFFYAMRRFVKKDCSSVVFQRKKFGFFCALLHRKEAFERKAVGRQTRNQTTVTPVRDDKQLRQKFGETFYFSNGP